MKNESNIKYSYSNRLGRILLLAMEEIIGRNGVNAVLNQARLRNRINNYPKNTLDKGFRFDETSQIMAAFEASYGIRGGRGLALRIGRASFKHILREYGPEMGFTDLASRSIPPDKKIQEMIASFTEVLNKASDVLVSVSDTGNRYFWTINRCPFCWHRRADESICLLPAGVLQEALYWVSGGVFYSVEETECIAKGDNACVIEIDKQPLD